MEDLNIPYVDAFRFVFFTYNNYLGNLCGTLHHFTEGMNDPSVKLTSTYYHCQACFLDIQQQSSPPNPTNDWIRWRRSHFTEQPPIAYDQDNGTRFVHYRPQFGLFCGSDWASAAFVAHQCKHVSATSAPIVHLVWRKYIWSFCRLWLLHVRDDNYVAIAMYPCNVRWLRCRWHYQIILARHAITLWRAERGLRHPCRFQERRLEEKADVKAGKRKGCNFQVKCEIEFHVWKVQRQRTGCKDNFIYVIAMEPVI